MQEVLKGEVLPMLPKAQSVIRKVTAADNFPPVGSTWEIFACDDDTGSFMQLASNIPSAKDAEDALGLFMTHPDFKSKKLFAVECKRIPVLANFNPRLLPATPQGIIK